MTGTAAPRAVIASTYLSGFVQGLAMISFAACGSVLKERLGFTDAQYGAIFIPQVVLAALGALGGGGLARAFGLPRLLALGFAASALSQVALAGAELAGRGSAFPIVLAGTALMGLGAGVAAAPLNTYPQVFFPRQSDPALVAMHALLGLGLAVAPMLVTAAQAVGRWTLFPLGLALACLAVATSGLTVRLPQARPPTGPGSEAAGPRPMVSVVFWLLVAIAGLYALAEASFSNWAILYLREDKALPPPTAAAALSTFWATLTAGRVLATLLTLRISAERVWLALPLLQGLAFLLVPGADTAALALGFFGLAGLGCSAFFPLTVGLTSRRFPGHVATVSSALFAALAIGVGAASFLLGALRSLMPLAQLYRLCALYPAAALVLALVVTRAARTR